jgi:hypothetical protein
VRQWIRRGFADSGIKYEACAAEEDCLRVANKHTPPDVAIKYCREEKGGGVAWVQIERKSRFQDQPRRKPSIPIFTRSGTSFSITAQKAMSERLGTSKNWKPRYGLFMREEGIPIPQSSIEWGAEERARSSQRGIRRKEDHRSHGVRICSQKDHLKGQHSDQASGARQGYETDAIGAAPGSSSSPRFYPQSRRARQLMPGLRPFSALSKTCRPCSSSGRFFSRQEKAPPERGRPHPLGAAPFPWETTERIRMALAPKLSALPSSTSMRCCSGA